MKKRALKQLAANLLVCSERTIKEVLKHLDENDKLFVESQLKKLRKLH